MSFKAVLATNAVYKISNVLVLFLMTAILSRAMGVEGYGLLSLLVLNVAFFNMLTSLGVDSGITYSTALHPESRNRVLTLSLMVVALQIFLLLLTEALSFAVAGHSWVVSKHTGGVWWLSILFLLSIALQEKFTALLNGSHLYTECNRIILGGNLFSLLAFAFFFFVAQNKSFQFYLALFVLSNFLLAFLLAFTSKRYLRFTLEMNFSKKVLFTFFGYSSLVFVTNLIQFLAYRIDLWLIAFFRSETEVGWYALAVRLVQLFWILPVLFASIVFPKVSRDQGNYDHSELHFLLRMLNVLNVVGALFAFLSIEPLLILVFGQEFIPGVPAFQILLPGVILFSNATVLAAYFAGLKQLKVNLWGSVLCLLSVAVLDWVLIPGRGYVGAAIASSIAYSLMAVYFLVLYGKQTGCNPAVLFLPQKEDWRRLLSFCKNRFRNL